MKYILIKGSKASGKTETINGVCKMLCPEMVQKLYFDDDGMPALRLVTSRQLRDENYIITVKKRKILLVAGTPTGQRKRITTIIDAVHQLGIAPDVALIALSVLEKLKDFASQRELERYGKCIHETKIWRIPANAFTLTEEWKKRIKYLTAITLHNIYTFFILCLA